ncbi:hypothetical protein [Pseudomonas aeruginosa]|uniref:hypothetical protein n=1 Tax=Pseudomonas aeruginosa TaxID=287 RepID=UPI002238A84D|nr:hypothetical protein [Pseudomonas aeruginosa]WIK47504.1 hypothetical protein OI911_03110 [Pseudomonas aeruginosa]
MSSTQHQLIEQCATRLRGIVEALDNIHDTSPQRWSTDLDDVHSSAESLLAMIKDQAPPSEDQLIAAGLSYPLAKEDAVKLWYAGFRSEVVTVLEAWEAIGHDTGINPDKEELLESLRNMAAICNAHGNDMPAQSAIDQRQVIADAITGALAFGAQASQPPAADHWLRPFYDIGRAEGQRTQDLAMLVRMLASSLKRHAPESNLVARATNYLAAKGLAGTPLRDPPAPVEQAGGDERVIGWRERILAAHPNSDPGFWPDALLVEHMAAEIADLRAALARVAELEKQEPVAWMHDQPNRVDVIHRDVKDLLQRVPGSSRGIHRPLDVSEHYTIPLYAAPVAQAQHSVPEGWVQSLPLKDHQPCKPNEDRANGYTIPIYSRPVLVEEALRKLRAVLCDPIGNVVIDGSDGDREEVQRALGMLAAAPGKSVPQAWLDVQAERRRQIEAEGWTPEHDDAHSHGQMARAAACYALAGSSAPNDGTAALLVSLAWPWDEQWWKPSTARRDMVKACALALAEIERLDRAAASQGGPSDA